MIRRHWILSLVWFAACSTRAQPPVFPAGVAGSWRLQSSESFSAAAAPELIRKSGTRGGWRAIYEGPGSATVELYELTSSAGGLQMVQDWRPAADAVVWYTTRYFVVVKWRNSDRSAISAFIRALERQLAEEK